MSDAYAFIKNEDEKIKDFNDRMRTACKDNYVTDGQIHIVDGQPVVTLLWPDDAEDVGTDDAPDPIGVLVARVSAVSEHAAEKSEKFMTALFDIAEESIVDVQYASGTVHEWVTATDLYTATKAAYRNAEVVRHNFKFGKELGEGADAKGYEPIKKQDGAHKRDDTALIRYPTTYALVAYIMPTPEEDEASADAEEAAGVDTSDG